MKQNNILFPASAGKRIGLITASVAVVGLLVAYEKAMVELGHFTLIDWIG